MLGRKMWCMRGDQLLAGAGVTLQSVITNIWKKFTILEQEKNIILR